jgi:hypothetical protein
LSMLSLDRNERDRMQFETSQVKPKFGISFALIIENKK